MSTRVTVLRTLCALMLALVAGACDDLDLPKSWALTYPRVLGVRSEVVGDETRASPEPGEALRVRTLIAGREAIERLSYSIVACPTVPGAGELPSCRGEPFAQLSDETELLNGELAVELDVADDDTLEGFDQVLIAGVACSDGEARSPGDARADECRGGDEPALRWSGTVTLARDEDEHNANPELPADAIAFDDDEWTAVPAGDDPPLRVKADGEPHLIRVRLQDSGRERVDGEREELMLSHFSTAGALERRFSVLESSDPDDRILEVEWRSPRPRPDVKLPDEAKLLFVLRDQRGGTAFAERRLALDRD